VHASNVCIEHKWKASRGSPVKVVYSDGLRHGCPSNTTRSRRRYCGGRSTEEWYQLYSTSIQRESAHGWLLRQEVVVGFSWRVPRSADTRSTIEASMLRYDPDIFPQRRLGAENCGVYLTVNDEPVPRYRVNLKCLHLSLGFASRAPQVPS
jgi:hypothetical protein